MKAGAFTPATPDFETALESAVGEERSMKAGLSPPATPTRTPSPPTKVAQ